MNKEEVCLLIKEYSNETMFLSFVQHDHPAYVKLKTAGDTILPFLLERLQDSTGHDEGTKLDLDNDPWAIMSLIGELSNGDCLEAFPENNAGILNKLRKHILEWGENKNAR
jgi:hypothetical protein